MFSVMGTAGDRRRETPERFAPGEDSPPQLSGRAPLGGDERICREQGKESHTFHVSLGKALFALFNGRCPSE